MNKLKQITDYLESQIKLKQQFIEVLKNGDYEDQGQINIAMAQGITLCEVFLRVTEIIDPTPSPKEIEENITTLDDLPPPPKLTDEMLDQVAEESAEWRKDFAKVKQAMENITPEMMRAKIK